MAIFSRKNNPNKSFKQYSKYKPYLEKDFCGCCAFCLFNQFLLGGPRNFQVDHFKPKSKFPDLENEYSNLYYSCYVCNSTKRNYYPTEKMIAAGYRFLDYCKDDFSQHITEGEDGKWLPLTPAGEYTVEMLRLNSEHLIKFRFWLKGEAKTKGFSSVINWDEPCCT